MRAHLHLLLASALTLTSGVVGQRVPTVVRAVPDGAGLVALADGSVACVWLEGDKVHRIRSRTDGRRWGEPQEWGQWPGAARPDFAIGSIGDGEVLAVYADAEGSLWSIRSTGRRQGWGKPVAVGTGPGCQIRRITRVGDRWIAPYGQRVREEAGNLGHFQGRVAWSDDAGASWRISESRVDTFVRNDFRGERLGAHAPVVAVDGERVMLFATSGTGRIYRTESKDRGETWAPPRPTRSFTLETPIDVVPAPAGGLYVARQRARYGDDLAGARSVLQVARTENQAMSFVSEREVHGDPQRNDTEAEPRAAGWPSLLARADTLILCAGRGGARHLVTVPHRFVDARAMRVGGNELSRWTHRGLKAAEDPFGKREDVIAVGAAASGLLPIPTASRGRLDFDLLLPRGTGGGAIELLDRFVAPGDDGGDAVLARIDLDAKGIQKMPLAPRVWHTATVRWNLLGVIDVQVNGRRSIPPKWLESSTRNVCYLRFVGADGSAEPFLIDKFSTASFER